MFAEVEHHLTGRRIPDLQGFVETDRRYAATTVHERDAANRSDVSH
jgi:hypothetical protein